MADGSGTSASDVGGIVGIALAIAVPIGGGIRWLAGWLERRGKSRHAKLQAWHLELEQREKRIDDKEDQHHREIENRLAVVERRYDELHAQNLALRVAHELVAGALRQIDPENIALLHADQLLNKSFPLIAGIPADMAASLGAIDTVTGGRP